MLAASLAWLVTTPARAVPLQVDVHDSDLKLRLPQNAQILEDSQGDRTLAQVRQDERGWTDYHADAFNFAFNRSAWWVRVRLRNAQSHELSRILEIGSALQDEVDVHVIRAGVPVQHLATGDRRPFQSRPVATRVPSLPLAFAPGEQIDVYFKLATHDGLHEVVAPTLWEPKAYASSMQLENLLYGLYYGALLTGLVYHLFLFASTRQLNFGLYVLYIGAFLSWSLTFRGYSFQYLWPDSPNFNNQILAMSAMASYGCFALFTMGYFNTEQRLPAWMNQLMLVVIAINALCVIPACLDHYALSFALSIPAGILLMLATAVVVGTMWLRRSKPARYLALSFSALSLGVLLYYMRLLGMVPSNQLTENGLLFGSGLQILLLAFGLADQMNQLKAGKLRAERAALAAQAALNLELENLLKRRTLALEAANQRFIDTGIHDELTGAYNARHFARALETARASHAVHQIPMALCLFDLDDFKHYRGAHGHAAGDLALQRVAQSVQRRLRQPADQLFRLEGAEFAILLSSNELVQGAPNFMETMRADIESLDIAHGLSGIQVLTASFGMVTFGASSPAPGPYEVYLAALAQLKQTKVAASTKFRATRPPA